jgi:hypothetical protein
MPEFQVSAEIVMYAEIAPEGRFRGIDDLDDASSFYVNDGLTFTGEISFPIEVESEDDEDVEEAARAAIDSNVRFQDDNGIEWSFDEITITNIERITPPMNIDLAIGTLRDYLSLVTTGQVITPAQPNIEALKFLVDWATHQRHLEQQLAETEVVAVPGPPGIVAR